MNSTNHKVLVFGQKVFGSADINVSVDYCDIEFHPFPYNYETLGHLSNYDLIILDYSAFLVASDPKHKGMQLLQDEQSVFEKLMANALDNGTTFCFLYYDEKVPVSSGEIYRDGGMNYSSKNECISQQIGFRWLSIFDVRPYHVDYLLSFHDQKRSDFTNYYSKWGAGKNYFQFYGDKSANDIISQMGDNYLTGFTINSRNGKLIFLPCQRDFNRPSSVKECLTVLISSIITYITRSAIELPKWADTPIFEEESKIYNELADLQERVDNLKGFLEKYQDAKRLPFLSEYQFEEAVPKFFASHLNLSIIRNEEYKEDFWITDKDSEKVIIVETKTYVRGFKKGAIYSLYNHREAHKLDENFPALLVVNAHINANSWQEKLRPINPQDYEIAAKNNILIVRIEDMLYLWNAIAEGRKNPDTLLSLLLVERGWLEVKKDGTTKVHK